MKGKQPSVRRPAKRNPKLSIFSARREYALGVIRSFRQGPDVIAEVDVLAEVSFTMSAGGVLTRLYNPSTLLAAFSGTPLARFLDASTGIYNRWRPIKVALAPNLSQATSPCTSGSFALVPGGTVATPGNSADVLNIRDSATFINTTMTTGLSTGSVWCSRKDFTVELDLTGTDELWLDNNTALTTPNLFAAVHFNRASTACPFLMALRVQMKGFSSV